MGNRRRSGLILPILAILSIFARSALCQAPADTPTSPTAAQTTIQPLDKEQFKRERKELTEAARPAPEDADIRQRIAILTFKIEGSEAAIAYLRDAIREFPKNLALRETLAFYLFNDKNYEEAEEVYRGLISLSENSNYIERLIECLIRQGDTTKADRAFNDMIRSTRQADLSDEAKKREIARLTLRYHNLLLTCGLPAPEPPGEETPTSTTTPLDSPWSERIARLNKGADASLNLGYGELALSAHLEAAFLSGDGSELIDRAADLFKKRRHAIAMLYYKAVLDHFPAHARTVDLIDEVVRRRTRPDNREYFDPRQTEGYRQGETACRRLKHLNLPPNTKVMLEIYEIFYHYAPLPQSRANGLEARKRYAALLETKERTTWEREQIERFIEGVDKWLGEEPVAKEISK